MVRDRDAKFTSSFYGLLASPGVKTIHAPVRSPRGNTFSDRLLHTARSECLDWLLIRSADHLEHKLERRIPIRTQPYNEHRLSPATQLVATLSLIPRAFATAASSTSPTRVTPISLASAAPITRSGCPFGRAARRRPDLRPAGRARPPRLAPAGWRRCSPAGTTQTRARQARLAAGHGGQERGEGLGLDVGGLARAGLQEQPDDPTQPGFVNRRVAHPRLRLGSPVLIDPPAPPVSSGVLVSLRVRCAGARGRG